MRHDCAALPGTSALTAQRKQSGGEDGQAASVQARAALDGENAVLP